ncbi:MAG TPA: pitrilysin family protein [Vicinamibacterales bacterium]
MSTVTTSGLTPARHVLTNGVTVVVQHTSFSPAVTFSVGFRAGGLYEPDALTGLAGFTGRVIDRGTASRSAAAISEALDDCGVALKVSTNRHVTTLSCTCLSEDFAAMLALVSDVVRNASFPAEQIEKRRAETITSIRQDQDNPGVRASETLQALLYGQAHPYGRPAKGTVETVERFSQANLVAHHADRFRPSSQTVVVVGEGRTDETIELVERAFGDWRAEPASERSVPPVPDHPVRLERRTELPEKPQSEIAYGFVSINRLDPSYYSHWVMNTVLGQFGLGGRLAENIRERQGMANNAYSSIDPSLGPGPLVIRVGVDPANVEQAIAAIDHEVGVFGREGASEQELTETRRFLISSIPRMLENNAGIAAFLQTVEFFGLGLDYDRRLPALIGAVTREDVDRAAARVLDPSRACVAVAGPPAPK